MYVDWRRVILILVVLLFVALIYQSWKRAPSPAEPRVKLYLHQEKRTITLPLEEYLVGVVGAEMPSSFQEEALKAQAVTARTYTLRRLYIKHPHPGGAQVCDDINCCQAYRDPVVYRRTYGDKLYRQRFGPVIQAVKSTRGQVLISGGELIDPLYFSTCGGQTASAREVWGRDVPYLQSVSCSYCSTSPRWQNTVKVSLSELNRHLNLRPDQPFVFSIQEISPSQRIQEVKIDGRLISGAHLRQWFNLPSTRLLQARQQKDQVVFTCRGYGHGVGMCQYGANGMAASGKNYLQILRYYYHGVQVVKLNY